MNIPALLSLVLLFLVPSSVFGVADIENKNIISESKDGQIILSLEFGKNQLSKFGKIIPNLQSGLLVIGESIIEINESRTKIMGDSFVVHSENILIYAHGMGNEQYFVNGYLLGGDKLEPIKLVSIPSQEEIEEIQDKSQTPELVVLVQQDIKTFWNDTYDISVKVFDRAINSDPQFYQSLGAINQAEIKVTLKDIEGNELTQLSGQTDSKGFWDENYFVFQNQVPGGKYFVDVDVTYLESNNFQTLETFVISDTRDSKD